MHYGCNFCLLTIVFIACRRYSSADVNNYFITMVALANDERVMIHNLFAENNTGVLREL